MIPIASIEITDKESVDSGLSKLWKSITFQDKLYNWTGILTTKNNIGLHLGTVLVLDSFQKAVIIERLDTNKVKVKFIKPYTEIKQPNLIVHILDINFSYQ